MQESQFSRQDKEFITDSKILTSANPGNRILAYITDMFIATLPIFLVCTLLLGGGSRLSLLLLAFYPAPAISISIGIGLVSFETIKSHTQSSVTTDGVTTIINESDKEKTTNIKPVILGISIIYYLFYSLLASILLKGQTIGKKLFHLKVYQTSQMPVTKSKLVLREFLGKILINSIPFAPIVSLFVMLLTKDHKTLHDSLADTQVFQE